MMENILITDTGKFVTPQLSCLKKYKDVLNVVKFSDVKNEIEHVKQVVDVSANKNSMDLTAQGYESWRYLCINNHSKEILNLFCRNGATNKWYSSVTIIADPTEEAFTDALFVLDLLQKSDYSANISLILPIRFGRIRKGSLQADLLSDLSKVKTLAVYDPYRLSLEKYGNTDDENICNIVNEKTVHLLSRYKDLFYKMIYQLDSKKYFFDFDKDSFIDTESLYVLDDYEITHTLGLVFDPYYIDGKKEENDYFIESLQKPVPRPDGKLICEKLRYIRKEFAKLNNIDFDFRECNYNGPCGGTCEFCDNEARKLFELAKHNDNIKYPQVSLENVL